MDMQDFMMEDEHGYFGNDSEDSGLVHDTDADDGSDVEENRGIFPLAPPRDPLGLNPGGSPERTLGRPGPLNGPDPTPRQVGLVEERQSQHDAAIKATEEAEATARRKAAEASAHLPSTGTAAPGDANRDGGTLPSILNDSSIPPPPSKTPPDGGGVTFSSPLHTPISKGRTPDSPELAPAELPPSSSDEENEYSYQVSPIKNADGSFDVERRPLTGGGSLSVKRKINLENAEDDAPDGVAERRSKEAGFQLVLAGSGGANFDRPLRLPKGLRSGAEILREGSVLTGCPEVIVNEHHPTVADILARESLPIASPSDLAAQDTQNSQDSDNVPSSQALVFPLVTLGDSRSGSN
jgi:hypothetical protein